MHASDLVTGEIVGNDDDAGRRFRGETVLDIGAEAAAVDGAVEQPGRNEAGSCWSWSR
jgi:hypothetical protein